MIFEKNLRSFLQKFFPTGFPLFFEKKFQGIFLQKNFVKRDFPVNLRQNFRVDFFFEQKVKGFPFKIEGEFNKF